MRDRTISTPLLPPLGTIEGASRYSRSRHLLPDDIAASSHGTRQPIPVIGLVSPDHVPHDVRVDYAAMDRATVLRRAAQARLDAAVVRYRTVLLREAPGMGFDVADRCARQLVQVLVAEGRV